jgi:hypothetical protein|uniref:Uncharacterized protein n=1 Tax=viral metagenome TaxID=1070528 RepID=A0A6C0ECJ0_9ZZZZ
MHNNSNNITSLEKIKETIIKKYKYITKILNNDYNYIINFFNSGNKKLLGIYNNNKLILAGEYNFYGIYQKNRKLWVWASSIPGINKYQINNINKIKSLNYLFELYDDNKSNFYYQLLTQDVLIINSDEEIIWINQLLLYLSDDIFYFNPINSDSNIQFLTLRNIKEKYI